MNIHDVDSDVLEYVQNLILTKLSTYDLDKVLDKICQSVTAITTTQILTGFILTTDKTNTYELLVKEIILSVFDGTNNYIEVSSVDEVEITPNSYYYDTTFLKLYVHSETTPNNISITYPIHQEVVIGEPKDLSLYNFTVGQIFLTRILSEKPLDIGAGGREAVVEGMVNSSVLGINEEQEKRCKLNTDMIMSCFQNPNFLNLDNVVTDTAPAQTANWTIRDPQSPTNPQRPNLCIQQYTTFILKITKREPLAVAGTAADILGI